MLGSLLLNIRQHTLIQRLKAEVTRLEKSAQSARQEKKQLYDLINNLYDYVFFMTWRADFMKAMRPH
ncbi:MAG: hypothetical protein R6X08_06030 [Desulfosalsimonadaceae bacterium]